MIIKKQTIEAAKAASVSQVIGKRVELKKQGPNLIGRCPFHDESTGSFTVSETKGIYKCFGCGAAGGALNFVMEFDKLHFLDAVKVVCEECNITIEYEQDEQAVKDYQKREDVRKTQLGLLARVQALYVSEMTPEVRDYLHNRGVSDETIEMRGIGFCPDWQTVTGELVKDGFLDMAAALGVVAFGKNDKAYDFFHHRITIPIRNYKGEVVSWGGRGWGEQQPKYLNGKESALFSKRNTLFGFWEAKQAIVKHDLAVITEGFFDVIVPYQLGLQNVVATMGTSLSDEQVAMIKRYTNNVTLARDGDNAGEGATLRDMETCLKADMGVHVMTGFDKVKDLDEWARARV